MCVFLLSLIIRVAGVRFGRVFNAEVLSWRGCRKGLVCTLPVVQSTRFCRVS